MLLPSLPEQDLLVDLCKEAATRERVSPAAVEKDLYLTRLIWALAQRFEHGLLLKGGTLLSKVDLGFHRMSEDVDMVVPLEGRSYKPTNAKKMDRIRDVLREIAPEVGMTLQHPDGQRFDRHTHAIWDLEYPSTFGRQGVIVEVTLGPVLKPSRRSPLGQLLKDPLAGNYADAFCWALDAMEARAEKVRAALTRTAGRDFYDLGLLVRKGVDMSSASFLALVNQKLSELKTPPLSTFAIPFDLQGERRRAVEASLTADLPAVVRFDEPSLDLDTLIGQFARLWS